MNFIVTPIKDSLQDFSFADYWYGLNGDKSISIWKKNNYNTEYHVSCLVRTSEAYSFYSSVI